MSLNVEFCLYGKVLMDFLSDMDFFSGMITCVPDCCLAFLPVVASPR